MFTRLLTLLLSAFLVTCSAAKKSVSGGWVSLFDGKSMQGWKVGANAGSFKMENGTIAVNGDVAHLYYDGEAGAQPCPFRQVEHDPPPRDKGRS